MTAEATTANRTPLDGTLLSISEGGISWKVKISDVQGLIDTYLASPNVLQLLPSGASALQKLREVGISAMPTGSRFGSLPTTLARFGLSTERRTTLEPFLTQSSQSGAINVAQSPEILRSEAAQLGMEDLMTGQVQKVRIEISRR